MIYRASRSFIPVLVFTFFVVMKTMGANAQEAKPLPQNATPDSPMNQITVETSVGPQKWVIDLASDGESAARGLMFVSAMPRDRGMLFKFERQRMVYMWMKNTFIPLDMVFMTETGTISAIHLNAVPHSTDHISSKTPARYVLELNAGEVARAGLKVGQKMRHPWFRAGS